MDKLPNVPNIQNPLNQPDQTVQGSVNSVNSTTINNNQNNLNPNVVTPSSKSKIPIFPIAIFAGILILIGVFFLGKKLLGNKTSKKEVEITYWGLWEDKNIIGPLISEYEAKNPGITIKYVLQSHQDYRDRLVSAMTKDTAPDIFRFHNSWTPMLKKELDYLPASVMSASEFAQTFYPVAISDLTSETGIVGIPLEYDAISLFINEDIFSAAGKTPPKTWDELRSVARELTVKDENGIITQAGVALGRVENVDHWQEILALMMLQNGVNLSNPTGKLAEDALTFFTIFSSVDGVWDQTLAPSTTEFAAGKLAMYFAPSWRIFEILQQNPNLKVRAISIPQLPKASSSDLGISYASYWVEGVWSKSQNKLVAWDFLKFLSTKESLQKLYQNASKVRLFGEPYSRVDMANLLVNDPIVGVIISDAPNAQSWHLYSRTWDGPTGINTLLSKYFEDGVTAVNGGETSKSALETVSSGVSQVLTQYGLMSQ
ncbi:extracellular solute-binding protein [Patescibacteria group bacterium]|nr:extracellular solute-binding protein [Patescibacteria group bacterium]